MPADNISEIEQQLEAARQDLFRTFERFNRKVESQLHLRSRVQNQPLVALAAIAGLGFMLGRSHSRAARAVFVAFGASAVIGLAARIVLAGPERPALAPARPVARVEPQ